MYVVYTLDSNFKLSLHEKCTLYAGQIKPRDDNVCAERKTGAWFHPHYLSIPMQCTYFILVRKKSTHRKMSSIENT